MDTPTTPTTKNGVVAEEVLVLMARNGRMPAKRLAAELGWKYSYLNRRLHGETDWTVTDLFEVAAYFDVPVTDLFGAGPVVAWSTDYAEPVAA